MGAYTKWSLLIQCSHCYNTVHLLPNSHRRHTLAGSKGEILVSFESSSYYCSLTLNYRYDLASAIVIAVLYAVLYFFSPRTLLYLYYTGAVHLLCRISVALFSLWYIGMYSRISFVISRVFKNEAWIHTSHSFMWSITPHPCTNSIGGLTKILLKLGWLGWVVLCGCKYWWFN